jgi:hypothetical protein
VIAGSAAAADAVTRMQTHKAGHHAQRRRRLRVGIDGCACVAVIRGIIAARHRILNPILAFKFDPPASRIDTVREFLNKLLRMPSAASRAPVLRQWCRFAGNVPVAYWY